MQSHKVFLGWNSQTQFKLKSRSSLNRVRNWIFELKSRFQSRFNCGFSSNWVCDCNPQWNRLMPDLRLVFFTTFYLYFRIWRHKSELNPKEIFAVLSCSLLFCFTSFLALCWAQISGTTSQPSVVRLKIFSHDPCVGIGPVKFTRTTWASISRWGLK